MGIVLIEKSERETKSKVWVGHQTTVSCSELEKMGIWSYYQKMILRLTCLQKKRSIEERKVSQRLRTPCQKSLPTHHLRSIFCTEEKKIEPKRVNQSSKIAGIDFCLVVWLSLRSPMAYGIHGHSIEFSFFTHLFTIYDDHEVVQGMSIGLVDDLLEWFGHTWDSFWCGTVWEWRRRRPETNLESDPSDSAWLHILPIVKFRFQGSLEKLLIMSKKLSFLCEMVY